MEFKVLLGKDKEENLFLTPQNYELEFRSFVKQCKLTFKEAYSLKIFIEYNILDTA